jgi:hypothetical protein
MRDIGSPSAVVIVPGCTGGIVIESARVLESWRAGACDMCCAKAEAEVKHMSAVAASAVIKWVRIVKIVS